MKLVLAGLLAATSTFITVYTVLKHERLETFEMAGFFFVSGLLVLASAAFLA